jgi:DnaJ-class molecular chaperone
MARSYYAVLGVPAQSTQADIRAAYRRLAKELHPDRYEGEDSPFLDVQEAYSVLGDAGRRRDYDDRLSRVRPRTTGTPRVRQAPRAPEPLVPESRPMDMGPIAPIRSFRTFTPSCDEILDWLRDHVSSLSRRKSQRVKNLTLEITLSREQCRRGGQARVMIPARAACPTCRGHGGLGPYACAHCNGEGALAGDVPVNVSFPPGITTDHAVIIPLHRYGIHNLYLTVLFRPSDTLL